MIVYQRDQSWHPQSHGRTKHVSRYHQMQQGDILAKCRRVIALDPDSGIDVVHVLPTMLCKDCFPRQERKPC